MTGEIWILIGFFACVMGLVAAAGYALVIKAGDNSAGFAVAGLFRRVGQAVPTSAAEAGVVRKRLIAAGYRSQTTVPLFYGIKYAAASLLAIGLGWATFIAQESSSGALFLALFAAFFGYILPDHVLQRMVRRRAERIRRALPDALDLLVLCVEAGQSLDQAIIDSTLELKKAFPDLSAELTLTHLELRAGKSRAEALRQLADRNSEPELRKLANLLVQSDRFGTSLGPALRVHAKYLRIRAKQQAQEAARKIGVKLLFPIFFLIFPCMLIVTVGPAFLQIFTQLLPMLSGTGE